MAYCTNCGSEIADGAKFCTNCGAPQNPHMAASAQDALTEGLSNQGGQPDPFAQLQAEDPFAQGGQPDPFAQPQAEDPFAQGGQPDPFAQPQAEDPFTQGGQPDPFAQPQAEDPFAQGGQHGSYAQEKPAEGYQLYGDTSQGPMGQDAQSAGDAAFADRSDPEPRLTFVEALQTCFSKYADFSGRARRSEFWYFILFYAVVHTVLGYVGNAVLHVPEGTAQNLFQTIFATGMLVPYMSVSWRRMHDTGRTGLWFLLNLIPVIGQVFLLIFETADSKPGMNKYGMSPKYPVR